MTEANTKSLAFGGRLGLEAELGAIPNGSTPCQGSPGLELPLAAFVTIGE